jgi:anionic cell wall polymer biosynthesis LytR-Cps2A-Psr (LCP) family protein
MDGKTALVFVRSRYAEGAEGTDFARSKRQEKIIEAFRQKVFSVGTLINVGKMVELYNILQDSIDADIKEEEFDDFIRLAQKMKDANLQSFILDYGDEEREGLLINPPISNEYKMQWVLTPRIGNGDFSEIHDYIACLLSYKKCEK